MRIAPEANTQIVEVWLQMIDERGVLVGVGYKEGADLDSLARTLIEYPVKDIVNRGGIEIRLHQRVGFHEPVRQSAAPKEDGR